MKNMLWNVIWIVLLSVTVQAGEKRGLQLAKFKDQAGQEVGLYEESHALVIGVSDYTGGWPDLPGVKQDVQAVKTALEEQGFQVTTVEDPTRSQLERTFHEFITQYGQSPDNRLLIYFAGHGHTLKLAYGGEMGYIVPVEAPNPYDDERGFLATAMDMQQIEVYARRIQSKHALFLFDSCFSGSIFSLSRAVPEHINYKTAQPVRQFMTSGSAEEQVPDESIFRRQFIAALLGEADVNGDGYITGSELGEFLQGSVVNYSKSSQHPQYGKIRDPNLDKGDFVFVLSGPVYIDTVQISPEAAQAGDPEVDMWELVKHSDTSSDIEDFLAAFPQGRFANVAQLKLKQLQRQQVRKEEPESAQEQSQAAFEFVADFEHGFRGFDEGNEKRGGKLTIIDDPTGSKRGKVLKGKITKRVSEDDGYEIYPQKTFSFQEFPCRIQEDIWISQKLYDDVLDDEWFGYISLYGSADWDHGAHCTVNTALWDDRYMHLGICDADENQFFPDLASDAPMFESETWHTITLEIDASGMAALYQDHQLVSREKLHPTSRNGLEYVHGGPITGPAALGKGGYVLVDNLSITCW